MVGLAKFSGRAVRQRASSPKLQVLNTALMTASFGQSFTDVRREPNQWGRLVESSVGSTLANGLRDMETHLFYWSGLNREVDFVLHSGKRLVAIEVKSGRRKNTLPGIEAMSSRFKVSRKLLVGADGIPVEDFLATPPEKWLN